MSELIRRSDVIEVIGRFRNIDGLGVWENGKKKPLRIVIIDEINSIPTAEHEHDGCAYCRYERVAAHEEPCKNCKQNYMDKWKPRITEHDHGDGVWFDLTDALIDGYDKPYGEWVRKEDFQTYWYECSECGARPPRNQFGQETFSNYCPNCGCAMRGEGDGF